MTNDVSTGRLLNQKALTRGTETFSIAGNGNTAVLADRDSGQHIRLMFLDLVRQRLEPVPSAWYEPPYDGSIAALSVDGRLFSVYSESGPVDRPMTVTVYDRSSGKMVAKQTSEYISAGGAFGGGVTPDGQIEFENNRVGRKLVELKTGRLIGRFSFPSVRSANGGYRIPGSKLERIRHPGCDHKGSPDRRRNRETEFADPRRRNIRFRPWRALRNNQPLRRRPRSGRHGSHDSR